MNASMQSPFGVSQRNGRAVGELLSQSDLCKGSRITAPIKHVRHWNLDSIKFAILGAYAPRGVHPSRSPHSSSLRAARMAAVASSQTITIGEGPTAGSGSFARSPNSLLASQDEARGLQSLLKAGSTGVTIFGQCNKTLRDLCAAGERWGHAKQVYYDFRTAGVAIDLETYKALMNSAIQAQQGMDVVELLQHSEAWYGPAPVPLYCSLISRLLKRPGRGAPSLQAACAVWQALRASRQQLDVVAYRTGMNLCVELGRIDEARQLMSQMQSAGYRPGFGAYHILMKYYARRGDMEGARRMFRLLRDYRGDRPLEVSAYNTLLSGFVRLGDLTLARAVLDKARREGAPPDAYSYSCYASGLVAAGRLDEAEGVLAEMAAAGVPPSLVVYGAVLDGCARLGDWVRADRLLCRMRADGLRPTLAHYNMLVRGRAYGTGYGVTPQTVDAGSAGGRNRTGGSRSVRITGSANSITNTAPDSAASIAPAAVATAEALAASVGGGTGSTIARGGGSSSSLGAGGGSNGAYQGSLNGASGPNGSCPGGTALGDDGADSVVTAAAETRTWNGVGSGDGGGGGINGLARASFSTNENGSSSGGDQSNEGNPHVDSCRGVDTSSAVETLLAEMRASGLRPDAITYGTLIHATVRNGSIEGALEVLAAMRVEGLQPDGVMYTSLMKLFRLQGRQAQALEFFQQLTASRSAAVDDWSLSCLVAVHASAGQMAEAEAAVVRANQFAAEQGRPPPPEATYALLQGYGQKRQLRPALLALRRFLAGGGRPHRKMCEFTYRLALSVFDFGAAAQVLRAMRLMRGLELREERYRAQWQEAQRRLQARRHPGAAGGFSTDSGGGVRNGYGSSSGGSAAGNGTSSSNNSRGDAEGREVQLAEKWKWWFGLPNNYYSTDWR